jgi:hypothetical protein
MAEYTEKQLAFLEALCTPEARGDIRTAMTMAGYSSNTRLFEVVNPLREEIIERAGTMLAMNAPKAAHGLVDVLNDPGSMGARNAVAAAAQILDRTGLVKREEIKVEGPAGGLFILPPKQADVDGELAE